MSTHGFFRYGRQEALAEVRILQHAGQWTSALRAQMRKQAVTTRSCLKHASASLPEARAYFAGRIAALKSDLTADFSVRLEQVPERTGDSVISRPLPPNASRFCGSFDCCETAVWALSLWGDKHALAYLCDRCRQEWQRQATSTTPDGWDWYENEDLIEDRDLVHQRQRSLDVLQSELPLCVSARCSVCLLLHSCSSFLVYMLSYC